MRAIAGSVSADRISGTASHPYIDCICIYMDQLVVAFVYAVAVERVNSLPYRLPSLSVMNSPISAIVSRERSAEPLSMAK